LVSAASPSIGDSSYFGELMTQAGQLLQKLL